MSSVVVVVNLMPKFEMVEGVFEFQIFSNPRSACDASLYGDGFLI